MMKVLTHEEAVKEVYRLTPQIKDYDEFMYLGARWLPYTMFFHHHNFKSRSINTDGLGFRVTSDGKNTFTLSEHDENTSANILIGGSNVLGTGATKDEYTFASCLSRLRKEKWLNFGGRGYNATQELILFIMHQHRFKKIENIVVFSGINTLALEGLPDHLANEHGRYYYSYEFQHYMDKYNNDLKRRNNTYGSELDNRKKNIIARSADYLKKKIDEENPADVVFTDEGTSLPERVTRTAETIVQHLAQLSHLAKRNDAHLTFVLQPMSYWCNKVMTREEKAVFHAIDSCPNNFWRLFGKILTNEAYLEFSHKLNELCGVKEIEFHDMNKLMQGTGFLEDYIFVDRVHFNDHGHTKVSEFLCDLIP